VGSFGWPELLALLTSIGYGIASAVFPAANAETYVVAAPILAVAGTVSIAIAVGIGQSLGKLLLFLGVRHGRELPIIRRRRAAVTGSAGPIRGRFQSSVAWLLRLVGKPRWGLPIVGVAAVTGIPPLYPVALFAGATKMRAIWFFLVVVSGRIARFVIVALGIGGLAQSLI
jgi:membrane protein YqaA with SNARE-associated domain